MIYPYVHPAFIRGQIIHAIRNHLSQERIYKVMNIDLFGVSLGVPLAAGIFKGPDQLLLLGIHRDNGLFGTLKALDTLTHVVELRIAVWVGCAFARLAVGLQAIMLFIQQRADTALAAGGAHRRVVRSLSGGAKASFLRRIVSICSARLMLTA